MRAHDDTAIEVHHLHKRNSSPSRSLAHQGGIFIVDLALAEYDVITTMTSLPSTTSASSSPITIRVLAASTGVTYRISLHPADLT